VPWGGVHHQPGGLIHDHELMVLEGYIKLQGEGLKGLIGLKGLRPDIDPILRPEPAGCGRRLSVHLDGPKPYPLLHPRP